MFSLPPHKFSLRLLFSLFLWAQGCSKSFCPVVFQFHVFQPFSWHISHNLLYFVFFLSWASSLQLSYRTVSSSITKSGSDDELKWQRFHSPECFQRHVPSGCLFSFHPCTLSCHRHCFRHSYLFSDLPNLLYHHCSYVFVVGWVPSLVIFWSVPKPLASFAYFAN